MTVDSMSRNRGVTVRYDHARFERRRRFLRFLIKYLGIPLLAKIDHAEGLENVPKQGAAILMINHIAFVDSIIVLHFTPRNIVPLAKVEVLSYPVISIFPKLWGVIPLRRQEVDRKAIKQVFDVLRAGEIVLVAPEGTRGSQLRRGKEGVAYLASRTDTPIIPVAIQGTQGFPALRFTTPWIVVLAIAYALVRAGGKIGGMFLATRLVSPGFAVPKRTGEGLVTQGGLSVALAVSGILTYQGLEARGLTEEMLFTVVVLGVVISDLMGPVLTTDVLRRAGEISPGVEEAIAQGDERSARSEAMRHGPRRARETPGGIKEES